MHTFIKPDDMESDLKLKKNKEQRRSSLNLLKLCLLRKLLLQFLIFISPSPFLLFSSSHPTQPAADIKVPFGFQWGESAERVERMLTGVKAVVEDRRVQDGRMVYTVNGISQRLLLKTVFYFDNDSLTEIELRYGEPSWTETHYSAFFDRTRRHIEEKYGPGRLIAQTRSEQHGCHHTLIGYQWTQRSASLQLFLFAANRKEEGEVCLLSLHYRSM